MTPGTDIAQVAPCAAAMRAISSPSSRSHSTLVPPVTIGMTIPWRKPVAWPRGAGMSMTSSAPRPRLIAKARSEAMTLLCVSRTPLGLASDPEVNMTAAMSWPPRRAHRLRGRGSQSRTASAKASPPAVSPLSPTTSASRKGERRRISRMRAP